ncbi:holin family protein [Pseudooceanicola sp. HF7]|uniref:holin family protein n=1 Tax=Pseudooceanicola sp. HF7 TaxID=2721560 RepID=UPI00142FB40B|nr:holin family protein [Pseudooceanicola sp. HF7]NIZ10293.1 carboxylesterase [Pseudooceanicola sp. HF7]
MGLIDMGLGMIFGNGRNVLRDTAEVFRPNAEAGAQRDHEALANALTQFGAEFRSERSGFDRVIDGVNRLPRPAMAFGAMGLIVAAMVDPVWFAARMQGLALVPEALWWLLGAVVSFYFGARHQVKGQQFRRDLAQVMARVPQVSEGLHTLEPMARDRRLMSGRQGAANTGQAPENTARSDRPGDPNPALEDWLSRQ